MKDLEFYDTYTTTNYSGPAVKAGAGVTGTDLYEFANAHGKVAVGGECRTVGWAGGYIAGGGHSPVSSVYGMAADQVSHGPKPSVSKRLMRGKILSIDVVTPDGRFVTADDTQNTDLFWALSGGGGSKSTSCNLSSYTK